MVEHVICCQDAGLIPSEIKWQVGVWPSTDYIFSTLTPNSYWGGVPLRYLIKVKMTSEVKPLSSGPTT